MDLSLLVDDSVNCLEVYLLPPKTPQNGAEHWINAGWAQPPLLPFGNPTKSNFVEYAVADMTYAYDLANDGQRVFRRHLKTQRLADGWYATAFDEESLPIHRCPCTDDIANKTEILRISYRINNRMFVHHDYDGSHHYIYIRYNHSPRMDMAKMHKDFTRCMSMLR
jgi:hypothetical protein